LQHYMRVRASVQPPPPDVLFVGLRRYEKLLFSHSAADFRRDSQSFEVLKSLNQSIRGLLKALSPYFLLRPSLKVLEFLIRNYSVQVIAASFKERSVYQYCSVSRYLCFLRVSLPLTAGSFLGSTGAQCG